MESGEPDCESLFENMQFDEAMNAVEPVDDDPELQAEQRRFLRMAALIQECARIDKECQSWVHRSNNSQAQVAARVKASFDSYNKLLDNEDFFPKEPTLTQKSCQQVRLEKAAQIIVARTLHTFTRSEARDKVKTELMKNLVDMRLTPEGTFRAKTICKFMQVGVRGVQDVIERSAARHRARRKLIRALRLPVPRHKLQEFTAEQIEIGLSLNTKEDILELFQTNRTAYNKYCGFVHWICRTRYSNKPLHLLDQEFQHRCTKADDPALVTGLFIQLWAIFRAELRYTSMPSAEAVENAFHVWGLDCWSYNSKSSAGVVGAHQVQTLFFPRDFLDDTSALNEYFDGALTVDERTNLLFDFEAFLMQQDDKYRGGALNAFKESLDIQIPIGDDGQPLLGHGTNLPRSVGCTFQITEVLGKFTQVKWSGDGCVPADKRDKVLDVLRDTKGWGTEYDYPAIT